MRKKRQFLPAANNNKKISREKPRGIIVLNRSIDRNVAVTPPTFRFVVVKRLAESENRGESRSFVLVRSFST